MARKLGLSIRYKILLLMTLLPLVILAVYLFMAVRIFEEDKIAYVFESSSSVARNYSIQATSEFESILTHSKPALQEFVSRQKFAEVSVGLFQVQSPVQWIAAFRPEANGSFTRLDLIEREVGKFEVEGAESAQNRVLTAAMQRGRVIEVPYKDDRVILTERVVLPATPQVPSQTYIFVMMAKTTNLRQEFQVPGQTENYLVDPAGLILFGPIGKAGTSLLEHAHLQFLLKPSQVRQGTEEVKAGTEPMLASFSITNFGQFHAVSFVPKRAALKAVQTLLRQSLIFFVVLICITVIVSLLASSNLTSALTELFEATQKVAEGQFDIRVPVTGGDEVGSLAASFNAMAEEVARLMLETAEKARMEGELKTAQTVQETLFPPSDALIRGLSVSGFYEPASECGGDWWHYCEINGKVFVWIGDATGHGAPAALITSAAKSAATVIERLDVGVGVALGLLNRAVYEVSKGRIMMTFFLGCYDPETRVFTYSNASHEAPFLIRKGTKPLAKKDLIPLNDVISPRLGQAIDSHFDEVSIELLVDDRILFYTDGIPDIQSPKKEAWGEREFVKGIIATNKEFPPVKEAVSQLTDKFQAHRQGAGLIDDITFFMIQVENPVS